MGHPAAARAPIALPQMERLRFAFTTLARGEAPGVGLDAAELPRVLRNSGVADSLSEGDLSSLSAALEAAVVSGRIDVDAFYGALPAIARPPARPPCATAACRGTRAAALSVPERAAQRVAATSWGSADVAHLVQRSDLKQDQRVLHQTGDERSGGYGRRCGARVPSGGTPDRGGGGGGSSSSGSGGLAAGRGTASDAAAGRSRPAAVAGENGAVA